MGRQLGADKSQWHGIRPEHGWHGFYGPACFHGNQCSLYCCQSAPERHQQRRTWQFGGLILSGNTLYGTTWLGGSSGHGTVFAMNTDGTGFTTLHNFTGGQDGANPQAALILSDNTLYGMARYGGIHGDGTVLSISFPPQVTIIPSGTNLILTWPTNYAGFDYTGYTLGVQHKPRFIGILDHQFSRPSRRERAEHSDEPHHRHPNVFPVEPVITYHVLP